MENKIGEKIKELRLQKELTLKDVSEKSNLSISFLSQVERGLTSVSILTLQSISEVLEVDLSYFFTFPKKYATNIKRSFEQEYFRMGESDFIYYSLSNDSLEERKLDPMLVNILPCEREKEIYPSSHKGEEFLYVLEGILTLYVGTEIHQLYPGDSYHICSNTPHEWANYTNTIVKVLSVNTPSVMKNR